MNIKSILFGLVIALIFQACDQKEKIPNSPSNQNIQNYTQEYTQAFNIHDADKLSSLWTDDALYINLTTGETIEGKSNIANFFKTQFEKEGADNLSVTLSSISSSGEDDAIAKGLLVTTYKNKPRKKEAFLAQYVEKKEGWEIKSFSVNELNPPTTHHHFLKELDWLVGKWVDDDNNIDVTYDNSWEMNENFLRQQFVMNVLGHEELRGIQMIGWNPATKQIQSWTFDSDGGIGEGIWTHNDNRWTVAINFVMPNGSKATATHVYTKIDPHLYIFSSEERKIEGKSLPNIGPYKIVKQH